MALGISTLKLKPISEYPPDGGYQRWTPADNIAGALNGEGANYGPSSSSGNEQARAHYFNGSKAIPKPEYLGAASLEAATIHFQYQMGRTGGYHVFRLYGSLYSGHDSWNTPDIEIYGEEELAGTVNERRTDVVWDDIFWRYIFNGEDISYMGPRCSQAAVAQGCWAKVWDFYVEIEFLVAAINTDAATDITSISAKGNGEIVVLLDGTYEERGFEYYKDGDEGNVLTVNETGEYWPEEFSLDITGLIAETKYYVRAYAKNGDLTARGDWVNFTTISGEIEVIGSVNITTSVEVDLGYGAIETIRAYRNTSFAKMELTGEITKASNIYKRGFEYIVQDAEPAEEAVGTEITEESETPYIAEEYTLNDYDAGKPLYDLDEDTIFWFRAIIYLGGTKVTGDWMKNVPTVTTDGAISTLFTLTGEGNLTDLGANVVTKKGFRIVKNFVGSIFDTLQYRLHGFNVYSQSHKSVYDADGILIGHEWVIIFERYDYSESAGFSIGEYETIMGGSFGKSLIPGDTYDIYAFAENNLGRGFGGALSVTTLLIVVEGEPVVGTTTAEKKVYINNLPGGIIYYKADGEGVIQARSDGNGEIDSRGQSKIIRAGIRYGRTASCNEGYIEKEGEWENGESIEFLIVDLVPDTKYYEQPYFVVEDSEGNQEEVVQHKPDEETSDKYHLTIACTAGVVTVTTGENHGLSDGDTVEIYDTGFYDGVYTISNTTADTFQFNHICFGDDAGWWHSEYYEEDPYEDKYQITKVEDAGGGKVRVTTGAAHELANGDFVMIYATTYYDGEYEISNITADTFEFIHSFDGDDTGYWWYADELFPFEDIDTIEDPDWPEYEMPVLDEFGIDYELVISEIKCSKISAQSIIDMYGRRRSTEITNNLIQDIITCKAIIDDYINQFQTLKLKVNLDYDIPIPFEREDVILLGDGTYNYKDDGEGVIGAKADGEGVIDAQKSMLAKIRKMDLRQVSGKGVMLNLELEV